MLSNIKTRNGEFYRIYRHRAEAETQIWNWKREGHCVACLTVEDDGHWFWIAHKDVK